MIAELHLGGDFVAVGNGYVVHLVAESHDEHILCIGPCSGYSRPHRNLLLGGGIAPVTYNHLAAHIHAGADMTELAVAVSRLVEIHEIHVHGIPGYLGVILCVKVKKRLAELLQSVNPHLCGREGVHPCDDTHTFRVVCGGFHHRLYLLGGVCCAFVHDFDRQITRIVKTLHHFL